MADEKPNEGPQPTEDERLQKLVDDRLNKQLAVFSRALIDKLDSFSTEQSKKLDAQLEKTTGQIVDYLMPKVAETAKGVVDANFKALATQMKERQAVQTQIQPKEETPSNGSNSQPVSPLVSAIAGLLDGVGHMLQTAKLEDVVNIFKPKQSTAPITEMLIGYKKLDGFLRDFGNKDVDLATFSKKAHEVFDPVKS